MMIAFTFQIPYVELDFVDVMKVIKVYQLFLIWPFFHHQRNIN